MATFRISVNGQAFCESEDITVFTMVVDDVRRSDERRISLHARAGEGALQWLAANLKVGDEIRVQIVDRKEEELSEPLACGFCGRAAHDVSMIVKGTSAAICDGCAVSMSDAVGSGGLLPVGAAIRGEPTWACGFCGQHPGNVPAVVVRNGAAVCPECLRACSDIVSEAPTDGI